MSAKLGPGWVYDYKVKWEMLPVIISRAVHAQLGQYGHSSRLVEVRGYFGLALCVCVVCARIYVLCVCTCDLFLVFVCVVRCVLTYMLRVCTCDCFVFVCVCVGWWVGGLLLGERGNGWCRERQADRFDSQETGRRQAERKNVKWSVCVTNTTMLSCVYILYFGHSSVEDEPPLASLLHVQQ